MILRLIPAVSCLALVASGAVLHPAVAAEDKMTAVLSDDAKTLSYTPCAEDEAAECIAYAIDCRGEGDFGGGLGILVMGNEQDGPKVRSMAKTLLDGPFGETKVRFSLAGGKTADLTVTVLTVNEDEMNGDWDLTLHSYDQNLLFDALDKNSVTKVALSVADQTLMLSNDAKAAERLLAFKAACTK